MINQLTPTLILGIIAVYFLLLITVSYYTGRRAGNAEFFLAGRKSPWYLVAIGMIGASLSGVTFIYLGIIFNERVSVSYLMSGIVCLVLGFYLQFGGSGVDPNRGDAVTMQLSIIKQEQGFVKIAKIQRATLMERRRINIQTVDTYKRKIHHSMANLNILNG